MEEPSISGFNSWELQSNPNLASLNLSLSNKIQIVDEDIEEDELEEVEVDEMERLHLQKVSSLVEAAFQRVEKFSKQPIYPLSGAASEPSSCGSTFLHATSLPESLDGGKAEVEELKNLTPTFESALRVNQALQRRLTATLNRLEKTLQQNILRQVQLKEEEEEQGLLNSQDKDYRESRNKYFARPSSFAVPYFKDRTGMPAPMNADAKYKVDYGYLDLYSTRLRTWLTSEQGLLVREVQKEWKKQLINDWNITLKSEERKLKNADISEDERRAVEDEVQRCQHHVAFFTNVPAEKVDMPRGAKLDWDKVAAQAFDGSRSTEECQLLWENYMHPSVNRAAWTEEEDIQVQEAVLSTNDQNLDWGELAKDLDTGRTGFQVMRRWVSFIKPTIQPARWTPEGSKRLEDTVNTLRVGSHIAWAQVAQHITGYTKIQLQSRWRRVNPDQARGPFTSEEDFVVIKGLYIFGMNFELIAHFLPGRNRVQVRQRFKRTLLPGLTIKPWTWREDKKIIHNCSMEAQHWRRMSMVLPQRDTCQIRLRFYVLHFWQSISSENKLPPPLFPLSLTTKPAEVKKLREKITKLNPDVKIYLDSLESGMELMDKSVKPFEERRNAICKTMKPATLARFLQEKGDDKATAESVPAPVARRRGRPKGLGVPRPQCWPDKALTEFFLPGRTSAPAAPPPIDSTDECLRAHFHRLAQALQMRVRRAATQAEVASCALASLHNSDANLVNRVLIRHHDLKDYGSECLACTEQSPDLIPLLPPSAATVGAFRSLLLHKPKLEEMAVSEFLLFQVPRSQLHKLGTKTNTLNEEAVSTTLKISEEEIMECVELEGGADKTPPREGAPAAQSENGDEENEGDPPPLSRARRVRRKAAAVADIVNYVYSREENKPVLTKEPVKRREAIQPPSVQELESIKLEGEEPSFRKRLTKSLPAEEVMKEEDKLLFHRMMALFFWPSMLALNKPPKERVHAAAELTKEKKINEADWPDGIWESAESLKGKGSLADIDMNEQSKIIDKMEAVKKLKKNIFSNEHKIRGIELTAEDMKERIFKKNLKKLKRSLIMKRTWQRRRLGEAPALVKKKPESAATRPKSSRLVALQDQRRKRLQRVEKALELAQDLRDMEELEGEEAMSHG